MAGVSPRWRIAILLIMVVEFSVIAVIAARTERQGPPIPGKVVAADGQVLFTREDILSGQEVFLKYGLMDNGTIWGHGGYLGPDFSAEYLHTLALDTADALAIRTFGLRYDHLMPRAKEEVGGEVRRVLKENRYDPASDTLRYLPAEEASYRKQIGKWRQYFSRPELNRGLLVNQIRGERELQLLTAFFSWTAWSSVANRFGEDYSYTGNFPYDPLAGNVLPGNAVLWSALSLIFLLAGTAAVLFAFGRFNFLGWKVEGERHIHPRLIPGQFTPSQREVLKYFVLVCILFLLQTLAGGATAHYRADPKTFYGIDVSLFIPSTLFRTWHLQLAIFWIATAFIGGGLFLAVAFGGKEPKHQARFVRLLLVALIVVIFGSLLGELLGVFQLLGDFWFWFGHQGWEYLELGRGFQILLTAGMIFWLFLVFRAVGRMKDNPEEREMGQLFMATAFAIPFFYLPAMFFAARTHFSLVDVWRFLIVHLWVEAFFELFVTAMIAALFLKLGMVSRQVAARAVYLDAILYLGSGIIGTGHHWYWTGQPNLTLALSASFSAMEVVPLLLLTLDAWDFIKLTGGVCDVCGKPVSVPHKWTFYFIMAVGFWNFVGAGIFGFLVNLPIVAYFEFGTIWTANHAHTALMGIFGMFGMTFVVLVIRQVCPDNVWDRLVRYIRLSFWGLNGGLALMVILNLFPGGVLQLRDVLANGYWHARSPAYLDQTLSTLIEWLRLPADLIFIVLGVVPMLYAVMAAYRFTRKGPTL